MAEGRSPITHGEGGRVRVTVRFFGVPRQQAGRDSLESNATTIRDLLRELAPTMGGKVKEMADGTSDPDGSLAILKNGRNIVFINKLDTDLSDEDEVTIMAQTVGG